MDNLLDNLICRLYNPCGFATQRRGLYVIVTVNSRHFLRNVRLTQNVRSERRNGYGVAVYLEFERGKYFNHLVTGDVRSEKCVDFVGSEFNFCGFVLAVYHIYRAVHNFAGAEHFHKLAGTVECRDNIVYVKTFFVS